MTDSAMRDAMRWIVMLVLSCLVIACGTHAIAPIASPSARTTTVPAAFATGAPSALDLLATGIGAHRLVLLGEMHGTREMPALTADLVARYAAAGETVVLALEIDSREQARVDRYLASPGGVADRTALLAGEHWQDRMHDGRDSEAMLALIERVRALRAGRADVPVVLFDRYGEGDRDARMAAALREVAMQRPDARVIVLTGNMHAMVRAPANLMMDGKPVTPPMTAGRLLSDLQPLSIDVSALGGDSVICQRDGCTIQPFHGTGASTAPAFEQDAADSPWDATLTLPRFSPSPPAIETVTPATTP